MSSVIDRLYFEIEQYEQKFNMTPEAIYLGRDEIFELKASMSSYMFTNVDGGGPAFGGIPLYEVVMDSHMSIGCTVVDWLCNLGGLDY